MLNKIADNIWIVDGDAVSFYGMPYTTRMTIVRLQSGMLWIHSPLKISTTLTTEISTLGEVKYLISPNKLHHLFLNDWLQHFPNAICYASPGLEQKRPDIIFSKKLGMQAEAEWAEEIGQTIFKGSPAMEEVVFFHWASKTLILTDLIENFKPTSLNWWQRPLAKYAGILSPNGKTPIDWRLSFILGKKEAKKSLAILIGWNPKNIIVSHGECIYGNGVSFLKTSFAWV